MSKYKRLIGQLATLKITDDLDVVEDKATDALSDIIDFKDKVDPFRSQHYNYIHNAQAVLDIYDYVFDDVIYEIKMTKHKNDHYGCSIAFYETEDDTKELYSVIGVAYDLSCAMLIALMEWFKLQGEETVAKKDEIDLVELIKANPGCIAIIDNDHWSIHKVDPNSLDEDDYKNYDDFEAAEDENTLAQAGDDIVRRGDGGYGSGNCYGGDILQALAVIAGIKVESV